MNARLMWDTSLLSWRSVSGFYYWEKKREQWPQKVTPGPYIKSAVFQGKRKSTVHSFFFIPETLTYCQVRSKPTLIQTRVFPWHHLHPVFEGKPLGFFSPFTWTFCKWTHFHTFQPTPYSKISQPVSHPPARPTLMVTTPVWRASTHSHKKNLPRTTRSQILQHLWSLALYSK